MSNNIEMDYYNPDGDTWEVSLDGRYMSAVQNYLEADGIPAEGVAKIVEIQQEHCHIVPTPKKTTYAKKQELLSERCRAEKHQTLFQ